MATIQARHRLKPYTKEKLLRYLLGIVLPVITIVALIVLLAFSLARLSSVEHNMRIGGTPNMLWVVSQTHIASLKFENNIRKYQTNKINKKDLLLSFDLLKSRLDLLDDGPQRSQIARLGFTAELDDFLQKTVLISHLITNSSNNTELDQIQNLIQPFNNMLNQAANRAMINEWDALGEQLDQSRNQISQIVISLIGISLAGGVLCIHFLVTIRAKKHHHKLLDKEKALSQILIGSSEEAIIAIDMAGNCTVWSRAATNIFRQNISQALSQPLDAINLFFSRQSVAHAISKSLKGQTAVLLDQPLLTHAESKYLDLRCFPLKDGKHQIGVVLIATDVTEHRATQREIAMHRDHLEEVVKTRTTELELALKREQETNDLYRNLGAMISHQLRTPLAVIDSSLQRLMRRGDNLTSEEINQRCTKARTAIQRLIRLIESTLDAARMDAGQIEINNQQFDLSILINEIQERAEEWSEGRNTNVQLSKNGPVEVYGDITHIEHIILNLLSNAIKYSPAGSVINIDLKGYSEHIECIISNHIESSLKLNEDMLFQRYYRGMNAEGSTGIGIGLYMSRVLARKQNGDVILDQKEKGVIKFILTLPRKTEIKPEYIQSLVTGDSS